MLYLTDDKAAARFERAMSTLRNADEAFTADTIYSLTDLAGERLDTFRAVWAELSSDRRHALVVRLVETAETNFELDFSAIIHPALSDPDDRVRLAAIDGVLEDNSPVSVIERLMSLAQDDPLSEVRAAAARSLGQFVLKGELGKLPEGLNTRLQDTVLALYRNMNEDLEVRRRSLEAISNCGREGVLDLIREAYYADELPMRVSAVFAMGRSCDDVWAPQILEELASDYPEIRFEATRAAGELELRKALPRLAELAFEDDREIQEMAIWSLGEIGGTQARELLTQLTALAEEVGDDELLAVLQEAQAAANLAGEDVLPLFDFSDFEDEYDLDDEDDDDLGGFDRDLYGDYDLDDEDDDDFDDEPY